MFRSFVLSLLLILSGCASQSTLQQNDSISPDEGIALFRLTSNARSIGFFQYWRQAYVENIETGKEHIISFSKVGNQISAVYMGTLPEGTYQFTQLSSENCGAICISSTLTLSEHLGTFDVRPDRITDLGHLIYQVVNHKSSLIVREEINESWVIDYISTYYPNVPDYYFEEEFLKWNDSEESRSKHAELYKRISMLSNGLLAPHETEDGKILFGSKLGYIKVWTPGERILALPTGFQGTITAVTSLDKNTWIAGTENGKLKISYDAGKTWTYIESPTKHSSITYLYTYDSKLFVITSDTEKAAIYYTDSNSNGWNLISSHKVDFNFWLDTMKYPITSSYNNKLVTYLPGGEMIVTDTTKLKTDKIKSPGTVSDLIMGNDGVIRVRSTNFLVVDPYESHDFGKSWIDSSHSRMMVLPYFIDDKTGFGLHFGDSSLIKSTDGGETWNTDQEFPYTSYSFRYIKQSNVIFATDIFNTIVFSRDNGDTWEVVQ